MREARTRIAEVKKDRGFGKTGAGKGKASSAKPKAGGAKKAGTICWDCGEPNHWQGDGAPSGTKHVRVAESHNTEHLVQSVESDLNVNEGDGPANEVFVATNEANTLAAAWTMAMMCRPTNRVLSLVTKCWLAPSIRHAIELFLVKFG